jgi:heat shock protein HslJ/uncharacterized membrane protein
MKSGLHTIAIALTAAVLGAMFTGCTAPAPRVDRAALLPAGAPEGGPTVPAASLESLLGTTWLAEDIDQRGVVDRLQSRLHFSSATAIDGHAGCNSYRGSAMVDGTRFRFAPLATTRMMCAAAVMDQERRFLDALARARSATIANGLLTLRDESGAAILRFSSHPAGQDAPVANPALATHAPPASPGALPDGVLRAYVWQCAEAATLTMRNLLAERAIELSLPQGPTRLDQTVSGSGVRYANADESIVFWTRGGGATLQRTGTPDVSCIERRADSLREDARVRGVVYRALGNEPGWTLEVGPGGKLDWTTDYGRDRYEFEGAIETVDATGNGRTFSASNGHQTLEVTLRPEPCVDDGGVAYDHTASIDFAGGAFRGCAAKLN